MIALGLVVTVLCAGTDGGPAAISILQSSPPMLESKSDAHVRGQLDVKAIELPGKDAEMFTRYVKARIRVFQACYEKELRKSPKLAGTVTVQFTVTTDGRAPEVNLSDDLGNEAVGTCIKAVMHGWVFPFKPEKPLPAKIVFSVKPG
ncbi:MAG: AgmX/PglI C-terminal domain-containing protein [Myxococcaceae bacterium]